MTTALIQALSRLAGNRQADGTSSLVTAEDRKTIIDGCYDLMIAARQNSEPPQLFGPYAHLNGHRALPEDSWTVEDDPIGNDVEYFSIPLFAKVDVTFPVTYGEPDAAAYEAYADELRALATDTTVQQDECCGRPIHDGDPEGYVLACCGNVTSKPSGGE